MQGALPHSGAVWFCFTCHCTHIKHDHSKQPGCCCSTEGSGGSWGVGTQPRGSWSSVLCKLPAAPVPQGREVWLGLTWVFSLPRDCSGSHLLLLGRCLPQPARRKEVASNSQLSVSKAVLFVLFSRVCCSASIANWFALWGNLVLALNSSCCCLVLSPGPQCMPVAAQLSSFCLCSSKPWHSAHYVWVHRVHKAAAGTESVAS